MATGLFDETHLPRARAMLAGYTVETVDALLGLGGRAALLRGDVAGAARAVRASGAADDPLGVLIRLFVLGVDVDTEAARRAFEPLGVPSALDTGLLVQAGTGRVRAGLDVRPYAQAGPIIPDADGAAARDGADWWVVSDLGADVRPGPLAADHVLGIGSASLTLAQATPRARVGRTLDIGTGSGVQALHLATHADEVVATDVSARALRLAATTAALSAQRWELRAGSLLEPVAGEQFDLIVANPPFVVSPGSKEWSYRDGGLAGDAISESLVRGIPGHLRPGGSAHLLANWIVTDDDWRSRVAGWVPGGCDAWVWQREVADPGEYATLWLRDAGLTPATPEWTTRYDTWLDWFAANRVLAVGMGLVSLWRTDSTPHIVLEDVPQAIAAPIAAELPAWHDRARWLADTDDRQLLASALRTADGLVRERSEVHGPAGWEEAAMRLRLSHGMRWTVDTDDAVSGLVAACDGVTRLSSAIDVLAAALEVANTTIAAAVLPVVRDLVGRGLLLPPGPRDGAAA